MKISFLYIVKLTPQWKKAWRLSGFAFMAIVNVAIIYSTFQSENTSTPTIADQYFNHALKEHNINQSPLASILTPILHRPSIISDSTASNAERVNNTFYAFTLYSLLIVLLSSISFINCFLLKREGQLYTTPVYIPPSFY